jgi:hypothetical protein
MYRSLSMAVLVCWLGAAFAQAPDIEAWMARHFSGKQGVKQDAKADEALYTALGLDSLRKNRFIGEVQGTARLPNGSMPVKFVLWADTLEAILHLTRRAIPPPMWPICEQHHRHPHHQHRGRCESIPPSATCANAWW